MEISSSNNKIKKKQDKGRNQLENKEINNTRKKIEILNKDISEINIIYNINKKKELIERNINIINIFGSEFVKNNKNICKMIIDNKEYELEEKYNISNYNNNILQIKLKGIDNLTNMRSIFNGCSLLSSLPDI